MGREQPQALLPDLSLRGVSLVEAAVIPTNTGAKRSHPGSSSGPGPHLLDRHPFPAWLLEKAAGERSGSLELRRPSQNPSPSHGTGLSSNIGQGALLKVQHTVASTSEETVVHAEIEAKRGRTGAEEFGTTRFRSLSLAIVFESGGGCDATSVGQTGTVAICGEVWGLRIGRGRGGGWGPRMRPANSERYFSTPRL